MPRDEDMDRRLNNWARWKHGAGSGGLGYARPSLDGDGGASGYREAVVPTVDCEAEETDRGVAALEDPLAMTVSTYYLVNLSASKRAQLLGVSESTVQKRIVDAHRRLANWLTDQRQRASAERDRVGAVQHRQRVAVDAALRVADTERAHVNAILGKKRKGFRHYG